MRERRPILELQPPAERPRPRYVVLLAVAWLAIVIGWVVLEVRADDACIRARLDRGELAGDPASCRQ